MKIETFLPWPDKALSPNARVHWRKLAKAKKSAKDIAYYAVVDAGIHGLVTGPVRVHYTFEPPARYRYDDDGLEARMKAARDGIALALGIDDHEFRATREIGEPYPPHGRVKVEIETGAEGR